MNKKSNIQYILLITGILISSISLLWEYFFPVTILYRNIVFAIGLVVLAVWAVMIITGIRGKRRMLQKIGRGTVSLFSVIIIGIILILLNLLSYGNSVRIDLTRTGKHSLCDETLKVLSALKNDVKFIGFFQEGSDVKVLFSDLMTEYEFRSKKISHEIIDPDKNPGIAKKYDVSSYNTVVVESDGKTKKLNSISEFAFTNGLIQIKTDKKKLICFMSGHGEKNILSGDSDKNGYSLIKKFLESKGYEVKTIDFFSEQVIPEDCSVLVIAGPVNDFEEKEIETLESFVQRGGSLTLLIDPDYSGRLISFAKKRGVVFADNIVANPPSGIFGNDPLVTIIKNYGRHPAVAGFQDYTVFPLARPIGYNPEVAGENYNPDKGIFENILTTGNSSWIEKNYIIPYRFDSSADSGGPVSIGGIYSGKKSSKGSLSSKIIAIGDSDFVSNSFIGISGNSDIFVNCIRWVTDEEDMIIIPQKPRETSSVNITKSEGNMMFISSVISLPAIILLTGAVIFLKRRKL